MRTAKKPGRMIICTIIAATLLLSFGCLTGCNKTYRTDYLKKYSKYLDYSLGKGNWTLLESQQEEIEFADFAYKYSWWKVEYVDSQGIRRTLAFDNYTGSTPDDVHFSNAVIWAAAEISRDRIETEMTARYSKGGTKTELDVTVASYPLLTEQNSDLSNGKPVITAGSGLKLFDCDTARVFEGHRFYLEVVGTFEDEELYSRALASLYSDIQRFVKADLDVLIYLSLRDKNTGMEKASRQLAYVGGKEFTPELRDGQISKSWYEGLLRETYFPKKDK